MSLNLELDLQKAAHLTIVFAVAVIVSVMSGLVWLQAAPNLAGNPLVAGSGGLLTGRQPLDNVAARVFVNRPLPPSASDPSAVPGLQSALGRSFWSGSSLGTPAPAP